MGFIIPPIPEKDGYISILHEDYKNKLLKKREIGLKIFLKKILNNQNFCKLDIVKQFISKNYKDIEF